MSLDDIFPFFVIGIFALIGGSFIYKMIKHGGWKAAMFGAPIQRTVGEVEGGGVKLMKVGIRIHTLGGGRDKAVGVELVAKGMGSYQMMPVTLSSTEARKLMALLEAAVEARHGA